MKSAPEVIRECVLDAFDMNTPFGYALIGERVVDALKASGYVIQCSRDGEPKLSSDEIEQFTAIYDAALAGDQSARRAFHDLHISTSRMACVGPNRTMRVVLRQIEKIKSGIRQTAMRSIFFGEDREEHALMEEIIELCIGKLQH